MLEKEVEKYLVKEIAKLGGLCWKFESPGTAGVPDRVIMFAGQVVFVELKSQGKKPRNLQIKRLLEIEKQKVAAKVIDGKNEIDILIRGLIAGCFK